jgi:ribosomal protein S18 acetylase RimI-like enzyme
MMTSILPASTNDCDESALLLVAQLSEHGVNAARQDLKMVLERAVAYPKLGFVLLARDGAQIVGVAYSATLLSAEHCGFVSSLEELYVKPGYRGQGIGTALLAAVIERAESEGMRAIELEVDEGHRRVMSLYQRFSFRRLDRSRWLRNLANG